MIAKSTRLLLGVLLVASSTFAVHYEMPPCGPDEQVVQIMGVDGNFCSPQCTPDCPQDLPTGVTAQPTCALQSPDGGKYCALVCSPSEADSMGEGECGSEMQCAVVPNSGGVGICDYPIAPNGLRVSAQENFSFAITK